MRDNAAPLGAALSQACTHACSATHTRHAAWQASPRKEGASGSDACWYAARLPSCCRRCRLCFSFGAQPFAACGTTFPEDELHGAAGPADRAAVLARAKEAGLLVPVPREASSYKPPYKAACTAKPPV